jgi:hypothetical protein
MAVIRKSDDFLGTAESPVRKIKTSSAGATAFSDTVHALDVVIYRLTTVA